MITPTKQGNILIVDSDVNIVKLLRYNLSAEGFNVKTNTYACDVQSDDLMDARLVIVDAMEQPFSGLDLIANAKNNPCTDCVPIIMCTEPSSDQIAIDSLDSGADDFIMKPFSLRELLARVNALLRRYPMARSASEPARTHCADEIVIRHLNLQIDTTNRRVLHSGTQVPLTKTEFAILEFLLKNEATFFTRDQIYDEVWGDKDSANPRIVDTNISRLRKKLGDASKIIINRYGLGYAFSKKD